jgi:hypothetical protein
MVDLIPTLLVVLLFVFMYDQKVITSLQRTGKYDPTTHQTVMSRLFRGLLALTGISKSKKQIPNALHTPPGDLSSYRYDTTVCLSGDGTKTRLSYFTDENQHRWYKIEEINDKGTPKRPARYEPATIKFEEMKLQFV